MVCAFSGPNKAGGGFHENIKSAELPHRFGVPIMIAENYRYNKKTASARNVVFLQPVNLHRFIPSQGSNDAGIHPAGNHVIHSIQHSYGVIVEQVAEIAI